MNKTYNRILDLVTETFKQEVRAGERRTKARTEIAKDLNAESPHSSKLANVMQRGKPNRATIDVAKANKVKPAAIKKWTES